MSRIQIISICSSYLKILSWYDEYFVGKLFKWYVLLRSFDAQNCVADLLYFHVWGTGVNDF